jgi:phage tail-like protein
VNGCFVTVVNAASLALIAAERAGLRVDPFSAFNFVIEIDGILTGGFSAISGLGATTTVEAFHEGGFNDHQYHRIGVTSYSEITLEHGITAVDSMWFWYQKTVTGNIQRKNATIFLLNAAGPPVMWWDLIGAFPTSWQGPRMSAAEDLLAMESITLAYAELQKPTASSLAAMAAGAADNLKL